MRRRRRRRRRGATAPVLLVLALACAMAAVFLMSPLYENLREERRIEAGISGALDRFKSPTRRSAAALFEGADIDLSEFEDVGFDVNEFMSHLLAHFDYRIDDVTVDGDHAVAHISLSTTDGLEVARQLVSEMSEGDDHLDQLLKDDGERALSEELFAELYQRVDERSEEVTREVDVGLTKVSGTWEVDPSSVRELVRAMLGERG